MIWDKYLSRTDSCEINYHIILKVYHPGRGTLTAAVWYQRRTAASGQFQRNAFLMKFESE